MRVVVRVEGITTVIVVLPVAVGDEVVQLLVTVEGGWVDVMVEPGLVIVVVEPG